MARTYQILCAAALAAFGLPGCSGFQLSSIFSLQSDASGHDRVVNGSVEAVAQSTQAALNQMGLVAVVNRKGESVRISSQTANGTRFTLVLTRENLQGGEQTRVRMEWDGATDEQTAFQLLSQIETISRH